MRTVRLVGRLGCRWAEKTPRHVAAFTQARLVSRTSMRMASSGTAESKETKTSVDTKGAVGTHTSPASLSADEVEKIVRLIENDPRILMEVMANLEPENRRRLIVTGGAMEWFGKENVLREVEKADADKDREISPKDFDHWFASALKRRQEEQKKRAEAAAAAKGKTDTRAVAAAASSTTTKSETASTTASSSASAAKTTVTASSGKVPLAGLALIALEAGLPFVGFGFLDNATMILAGDLIDGTIGFYFHCSVLASAAMGNVCSGMLGMQVHGLIDKAMQKLNVNTPVLTEEQMKDRSVFFAGHLGGTIGILIGLVLGMFPLLFLDGDTNEKVDYAMFRRWDNNGSGFIELPEFEKVLAELGFQETHAQAKSIICKYGENNKVNFEQFSRLKADLREGRPIFE